ncbi:MAG: UvrB/UvrC motif-containing protein [Verrucomicrobiae bacterium]|nr:UvrB/UvrC motif-containing protein [Verrucomicrobiae bacterium]MCP5523451.1 UvrB/UvrC motif-containing protein [Verrucomicrobiales bacterium]
MVCMICKENEAKVHLTQVVGGKLKKVDLCEKCAKEKGIDDPMGFSLADLLMGLGASQGLAQGTTEGEDTACPKCGFTQADFKKSGRLGCADCYQHFAEGLEGMLKGMHKGMRHTGKTPHQPRRPRPVTRRIQSLQKQLESAVAGEDYEEAARLRDEIKLLRAEPAPPESPAN